MPILYIVGSPLKFFARGHIGTLQHHSLCVFQKIVHISDSNMMRYNIALIHKRKAIGDQKHSKSLPKSKEITSPTDALQELKGTCLVFCRPGRRVSWAFKHILNVLLVTSTSLLGSKCIASSDIRFVVPAQALRDEVRIGHDHR